MLNLFRKRCSKTEERSRRSKLRFIGVLLFICFFLIGTECEKLAAIILITIGIWILSLLSQEYSIAVSCNDYENECYKYGPEDYYEPQFMKFVFQYYFYDMEKVPKAMAIGIYIQLTLQLIYNIVFIIVTFTAPYLLFDMVLYYFAISASIGLICGKIGTQKCFLLKFKKMTIHNMRYLLQRYFLTDWKKREPCRSFQGKCKIMTIEKRGKYFYAEVEMLNGTQIYKNVLLTENSAYTSNPVGKLYEICKVKYI